MLKALGACATLLLVSIAADAHPQLLLPVSHFKTHTVQLPLAHPMFVAPTAIHEQLINSLSVPTSHAFSTNFVRSAHEKSLELIMQQKLQDKALREKLGLHARLDDPSTLLEFQKRQSELNAIIQANSHILRSKEKDLAP